MGLMVAALATAAGGAWAGLPEAAAGSEQALLGPDGMRSQVAALDEANRKLSAKLTQLAARIDELEKGHAMQAVENHVHLVDEIPGGFMNLDTIQRNCRDCLIKVTRPDQTLQGPVQVQTSGPI